MSPSETEETVSLTQDPLMIRTCPFSVKVQKYVVIGSALNVIVLIVSYCVYLFFRPIPSDIVHTKLGAVQGVIGWSRDGNEFSQYLGLPFARPPLGEKRFEPPEPALSWEGIRDASYFRPLCLQLESFATGFIFGKEDCLYLNVFVPKNGRASQKSVMVYIHGGIFHVGGSDFAGPKYFMDEDIVLVTLNYRLGVFGFLSTGDHVLPGNNGLKDQNMALQWIQENIHNFRGNPDKVTIFGESAGGASVHHQVIWSKPGLFYKAIHQSGSALNYWALYRNVKEQSKRFAQKFGCPTYTSEELVNCLKGLDGKTIVTAHSELQDLIYRSQITTFVPTIESPTAKSPFITEEPMNRLKDGRFNRVPIMTGVNSNEGQLISKTIVANQTKLNEANDNWYKFAPMSLHYPEEYVNVSKKVYEFYFGHASEINSTNFEQNFTNMFGDRLFMPRGALAARLESKFTPTYVYYYDYGGVYNTGEFLSVAQGDFLPNWANMAMHIAKQWFLAFFNMLPERSSRRACHSDEISMLFNRDFVHTISDPHPDYEMSKAVVKLWSSFANDDPVLRFKDVEWHPISSSSDIKYLRINEDPAVIEEPFTERRLFWETLNLPNV